MVPETSVIFNQLTRLIAREDFIHPRRINYFYQISFSTHKHSAESELAAMILLDEQ
jgi:hypothetical protein